jgi:shikimate kinase
LQRLARDRQRPLLAVPDRRARLEQMARERDPLYRDLADLAIPSAGESCQQSATRIATLLEQHWHRTPPPGHTA